MGRLFKILRIGVSISLMGLLLYLVRDDLHQILITLRNTNLWVYTLCFFLSLSTIFFISLRLKEIFKILGIHLTIWNCTLLNFIGLFFNIFLPTSAGGDLVKIYYASKGSDKKVDSITGVLADRFFGLFTIFLLSSIALLIISDIRNSDILIPLIWGIFGFTLIAIFLFLNHKFVSRIKNLLGWIIKDEKRIRHFFEVLSQYIIRVKMAKRSILYVLGLSLFIQFLNIVEVFLLSQGLSLNIAFSILIVIVPLIFVMSLFPSINGLGIREGAYVYFLGEIAGKGNAFALSMLFLSLTLFLSLIGGVIYVYVSKNDYFKRLPIRKAEDLEA